MEKQIQDICRALCWRPCTWESEFTGVRKKRRKGGGYSAELKTK